MSVAHLSLLGEFGGAYSQAEEARDARAEIKGEDRAK
jgi:hypothetical protein